MNQERFQKIEDIFQAALELPVEEREAFVRQRCGDDVSMAEEVLGMLAEASGAMWLDIEATTTTPSAAVAQPTLPPGTAIGHFEIVRLLGQGGMGAVYLAEQSQPKRTIALKLVRPGFFSEQALRRFDLETEALARLEHPGIARMYEAGIHEGTPFFAMEYVEGLPLTRFAEDRKLNLRQRLDLFARICDAVHHAHAKGVIHRDLKPANIIIDQRTDPPQPKILDFGVARVTNADTQRVTTETDIGQLIGTVPYMSPEQAAGDPKALDTRSDVYALGVVLYELLAGRLPYDLKDKLLHEMVRIIREDDPTRLSEGTGWHGRLGREFRGDIETIVGKALEKDKERRYQSALELASDVRRYLSDEPLSARPPSTWYQLSKFARRNKALVGGVAAVFMILIAATGVSTRFAISEAAARQRESTALASEREQRQLAEERQQEANDARTEALARAHDLEVVTEFQQSMLGGIDPEEMGRALFANLRHRVRESLNAEGVAPDEVDARLAAFDEILGRANATDAALTLLEDHVLSRATKAIDAGFADQPLVRAALQQTVAATYNELGRYEPTVPLQKAVLKTRRDVLGDDHPDTLRAVNNMGFLFHKMERYAEAEQHYCEALEGRRRVLGSDHPDTLESIAKTGLLLSAQGKLAEAEQHYREALKGRRRVLGDEHPDTLVSINNMGVLLERQGRLDEAEPYWREALDTSRRVLGSEHLNTRISIISMGGLLYAQGKLDEAEPYWREALDTSRRVLGNEHPDTIAVINNVGLLLLSQGKLAEADECFREALRTSRQVLGNEHSHTLLSLHNMSALLDSQGRLDEAERYSREALAGRRGVLGNTHPDTLISINNLGSLLQAQGKLAEAEPYLREALAGCRRMLGNEHPHTLIAITNLGNVLEEQSKPDEAEPYYLEALAGSRRVLGDEHPDTLALINNVGAVLREQGKLAEAEPYLREALETRRRALGDRHPHTLASINNMGGLLQDQNKLAEAEPHFREALDGFRRLLGDEHINTLIAIHNMGRLLRDLGRLEEAEVLGAEAVRGARKRLPQTHPFQLAALGQHGRALAALRRFGEGEVELLEASEGLIESLGADHRRTRDVVGALINLYSDWHAAEPDKGYDAKAAEWRAKMGEEATEGKDNPAATSQPASAPARQPTSQPASQPAAP